MKFRIALSFFVVFAFISGTVRSGDIATERTQAANGGILTIISAIDAAIQDATEYIKEYEELARLSINQASNFDLIDIPGAQEVIDKLVQMEDTIRQGEAVVHSTLQLEDLMKEKYKTYDEYYDIIADLDGDGIGRRAEDFTERFKGWSETHNQTIRNILKSHGLQAEQYDTERARFETLKRLSQTSDGRMQALQIGNEIATEELLQLTNLREISMEQTDLHANYFAMKRAAESEEVAFSEWTHKVLLGITDDNETVYTPTPGALTYNVVPGGGTVPVVTPLVPTIVPIP